LAWRLVCPRCGFRGEEGRYYHRCPRCGSPLEFEGDRPRYGRLLGEGSTPLVYRETPLGPIGFKLEYVNPTGSFKDRGTAYSLQLARDLGYRCVVEDSSGNAGISTAAYASFLGLEAVVAVPRTAAPSKKSIISSLGARVVELDSREDAAKYAEAMAGRCFYVAHAVSAAFLEGMTSAGREVPEGSAVVVPSASFSLFLGIWRGSGGRVRLYAVQGVQNATLRGLVEPIAVGSGSTSSLADGLVLPSAPRAQEAADAIRRSGGGLVLVSDKEIAEATRDLWSMGLMAEPTSASAYAALKLLKEAGIDVSGFIAVLTGSGLKFYDLVSRIRTST
jgi:threonine synthase